MHSLLRTWKSYAIRPGRQLHIWTSSITSVSYRLCGQQTGRRKHGTVSCTASSSRRTIEATFPNIATALKICIPYSDGDQLQRGEIALKTKLVENLMCATMLHQRLTNLTRVSLESDMLRSGTLVPRSVLYQGKNLEKLWSNNSCFRWLIFGNKCKMMNDCLIAWLGVSIASLPPQRRGSSRQFCPGPHIC